MLPSKQASSRCEITSITQATQINPSNFFHFKTYLYVRSKLFWASKQWPQISEISEIPVPSRPNTVTFCQHGEGKDTCWPCILPSFGVWPQPFNTCVEFLCCTPGIAIFGSMMQDLWFYGLFLDGFFSGFIDGSDMLTLAIQTLWNGDRTGSKVDVTWIQQRWTSLARRWWSGWEEIFLNPR